MTAQPKVTIKTYFQTGDHPTQAQFIDLIDSYQDTSPSLVTLSSASTGAVGLQLLSSVTATSALSILNIGTFVESKSTLATNFPTSSQFGDAGSIALTDGDWDVSFMLQALANGATVTTTAIGISQTSGNSSTGLAAGENLIVLTPPISTTDSGGCVPVFRVNVVGTTTVYAKIFAIYSVATPQFKYRISARRVK